MATTAPTVSAWGKKPGAWALDSEEHEEELIQQEKNERENGHHLNYQSKQTQIQQPLSDFPTLSAALSTKQPKKKKGSTTLSLSEFTTGKSVTHGSATTLYKANKGLTTDELLFLPTGPRERSAEELERGSSRLGGGFRSYGDGGGQGRGGREDSSSRWGSERGSGGGGGFNRDRENTRDSGPSRADETDDWGAAKKSSMGGAPSFERRERESSRDSGPSRADENDDWGAGKKSSMGVSSFERRERGGGGFFDSQSRADESDSWVSNKSRAAAPVPRRVGGGGGGGGFENRERRGGFEFQREVSNGGGGADSDTWGKKREDGGTPLIAPRARLVLQPKTLLPSNGEEQQELTVKTNKGSNPFGEARPREEVLAEKGQDWKTIDEKFEEVKIKEDGLMTVPVLDDGSSSVKIKRSSNPFGEARPREEVLAEKGQDWKKIDEQLESVKIKENGSTGPVPEDGKKVFSNGNGRVSSPEGRIERSWRKTDSVDVAPPPSADIAIEDEGAVAEN